MDPLAEAEKLFLEALALQEKGDLARAEACYGKVLALAPGRASVMNNLAAICLELRRFSEARRLCESILENDPADETALLNLGNAQLNLGSPAEALITCERVLEIRPGQADALNCRGNALLALARPEEALASYDRALAARPGHADALYNRGNALLALARPQEALASYDQALAVRPNHADTLYNRGNALMKLKRLEDALASYDAALVLRPDMAAALNNRGLVLQGLRRREELVENYRKLLNVAPDFPYIRGHLLHAQLDCCEWADYDESVAEVTRGVREGRRCDSPFHFLAISESAADQLRCARVCVADEYPPVSQPAWRGERYSHGRIRVAYVSADFHNHALSYLAAGLFESHDRTRFEITALSLGPGRDDEMRMRLRAAFDRFIEIGNRSDRETAMLLRELEIDIAVDLQGFTRGCRPGIWSHRAAPVQVNYLGYPGTMGAEYMDYVLGDRHVIPPEHQACYAEKIAWLPDCYQVNDSRRAAAERAPGRVKLGLPEEGFVFCCFNNNYKIAPPLFDVWMRVLKKVEGSVLWLVGDNPAAARNLRQEAGRRGVSPERLIFAGRVDMRDYLARYRLADLFLDTLPYNAHTTASDALWEGLPVLTCQGRTFAGRVAASLLNAVGLPDLVTTTWEDYERLALKLATDRELLAGIKGRLARNRTTHPLFDTDRFRRNLEAVYLAMWERAQRGEPPANIGCPPFPGDGFPVNR